MHSFNREPSSLLYKYNVYNSYIIQKYRYHLNIAFVVDFFSYVHTHIYNDKYIVRKTAHHPPPIQLYIFNLLGVTDKHFHSFAPIFFFVFYFYFFF